MSAVQKETRKTASAEARPKRILIVDDHPVVREGFAMVINLQPDLEVCGQTADAAEALRMIAERQPDLMIVDLSLKHGNGLELCKDVQFQHPHVKMLVASAHDEMLFAERVLHAGAMGYVNKKEATDQLVEAIRRVFEGRVYLSAEMTERMLCRAIGSTDHLYQSPISSLSDRELQVFELIGHGQTTRQIAGTLGLSLKTVESYRENIKHKLSLTSGSDLTRRAVQWVLEDN
jgi:DNA-binding NarL/FixJ family response regulator